MEWKIPFYNILNMLLTGVVFVCLIIFIFRDDFVYWSEFLEKIRCFSEISSSVFAFACFAIVYQIGFVINRIGSVCIEPYLLRIDINSNYDRFNEKSKNNPIMDILSREYALSRTQLTLFFILFLISGLNFQEECLVYLSFAILFKFSALKHNSKIKKICGN